MKVMVIEIKRYQSKNILIKLDTVNNLKRQDIINNLKKSDTQKIQLEIAKKYKYK